MDAEIESSRPLHFDDGTPVRAASAIAAFRDGWLIAQDDATIGALQTAASIVPLRLLPAIDGHDLFEDNDDTKHLKPDLEAACDVPGGVLLLGSGSTSARMRACLVHADQTVVTTDLTPLYGAVAATLQLPVEDINLEGACLVGDRLRWFHRGGDNGSASVDVDLGALLAAVSGAGYPDEIAVTEPRHYDLGELRGLTLGITDAVALPDGRILVSAAAEDSPNAVQDGPVAGSALALLDDEQVVGAAVLHGTSKVEGLALQELTPDGVRLLGVVDADDPQAPSLLLTLRIRWKP